MRRLLLLVLFLAQIGWAMDRQPNGDYHMRRQSLAAKISSGVVVMFAATESEGPNAIYGFRQDSNFFYLSGWSEPGAALLIAPAAEAKDGATAHPYTEILFLPQRNHTQEKWTGPKLGPENPDAAKITGFDRVASLDKLRDELNQLLPPARGKVYSDLPGLDQDSPSTEGLAWLRRTNAFPGFVSIEDVKPPLRSLRTVKDAREIELVEKATNASMAAHLAAMHSVKPGIGEREISALLQYEWGKRGCERPSYSPIVGSGFNSTLLHYSDDDATMGANDVLVIDAAGEYSMYATDITRTLPISGKFNARQREIYNIVLGAQQAAMAAFKSGKSKLKRDDPDSLFTVAYDYINSHGKDSHGEPLGKYFIHGLGHYVGLEVHDAGDYDVPLGPGMVFTIEPGIYIPDEKLGVRIEDMYYVDQSGKLIRMTENLPHTAEEVEKAMAER
jgi:Xaa-Pro aminopeptidase